MRFKMPILRRIDTQDAEGIDAAVYRDRVQLAFSVATVFVAVHIGSEGIVGFCTLLDKEIELIAVSTKYQRKRIKRWAATVEGAAVENLSTDHAHPSIRKTSVR